MEEKKNREIAQLREDYRREDYLDLTRETLDGIF